MLRRLAVLPLLALALVACSSGTEEQPRSLPPLSPAASPSPSPSPSPTAAAIPAAAQPETPQGAAEFATHWWLQLQEAYRLRDPELISELSDPRCGTCANFVRSVNDVKAQGLTVEGGAVTVLSAEASPENGEQLVDLVFTREPVRTTRAGAVVGTPGPAIEKGFLQMRAVRAEATWRAREVYFPEAQ